MMRDSESEHNFELLPLNPHLQCPAQKLPVQSIFVSKKMDNLKPQKCGKNAEQELPWGSQTNVIWI